MMTYGEMIQRLEQIVGTLEKGEASLEESLKLFEEATQQAKKAGLIKDGDIVVLTAGVPLGKAGTTNMLRVIEV